MDNRNIVALFDTKVSQKANAEKALQYIKSHFNIDANKEANLLKKLQRIAQSFETLWNKSNRMKDRFEVTNATFLDNILNVEEYTIEGICQPSTSTGRGSATPRGRPQKQFEDLSDRSKRRKIDELIGQNVDTIDKALLVSRKVAYRCGDSHMVKLIGHILKNSENASKMYVTLSDSQGMMPPEEAFEFFLDCDFSKYAYEQTVKKNPSRFPSYSVIKEMKKVCSPPAESIEETSSKIQVRIIDTYKFDVNIFIIPLVLFC